MQRTLDLYLRRTGTNGLLKQTKQKYAQNYFLKKYTKWYKPMKEIKLKSNKIKKGSASQKYI